MNLQVCWDHGTSIFKRCVAMCLAYDSGTYESDGEWYSFFQCKACVRHWTDSSTGTLQNDLVHGWGLDFALHKCLEVWKSSNQLLQCVFAPVRNTRILKKFSSLILQVPHERIGVVDAQWIIHKGVPSLGNQVRTFLIQWFNHSEMLMLMEKTLLCMAGTGH